MRIKTYSRYERKAQVIALLSVEAQHGRTPKMTMYRIAKGLDMSPSNHLTKILKEMVAAGLLDCSQAIHRPGVNKAIWGLKEGTWAYPQSMRRLITFNLNGKEKGVLSL